MPRVAFHTLGCRVNQYETEAIKKRFAERGFEVVGEEDPADVYVVNTCTVTGMADRKSRQYIRRMRRQSPHAVICATGCYVQAEPEQVAAIEDDLALRGTFQQVQAAHERGLARAAQADDAEDIALIDGKVDIVQRHDLAVCAVEFLAQMFDPYQFFVHISDYLPRE